jgi:NADPH:quinone reductase-like Zn-dependent oxidoreductase
VAPDGATLAEVAAWLGDRRLRIGIERVLPLARAAEAHAIGERGHVRGRLVLDAG